MDRWVVNASPIICLTKAGYSDLLLKLVDEIIVPQAVVEEIRAGHSGDPAEQIIAMGKFPAAVIPAIPEILAWDLGKGETAVLSFAFANPTWTAIIDDRAARKCAKSFFYPSKRNTGCGDSGKETGHCRLSCKCHAFIAGSRFTIR